MTQVLFRHEWPGLMAELVERDDITHEQADWHPQSIIVGRVGSIDNDMAGTDPAIGADAEANGFRSNNE